MIIRIYMDEDAMSVDLVQALRTRGVDVTTVQEKVENEFELEENHIRSMYPILGNHTYGLLPIRSPCDACLERRITYCCARSG